MNREERLRNLILDEYVSLRQFSLEADIPYSTLMTMLSRGIGGASFDAVIRICKRLGIDPCDL
ncbi:MAG: helix-turn-helix transcriptional regulator [Acetatifactor sp.]|nr:helix-turn-helix transcriptional regulator [Acetatifactor sp.]